jgi:hypothetical protein
LRADDNLQIRGNVIENAGEVGAPESVRFENTINGVGPNVSYPIPAFDWSDAPQRPRVPPPVSSNKRRAAAH